MGGSLVRAGRSRGSLPRGPTSIGARAGTGSGGPKPPAIGAHSMSEIEGLLFGPEQTQTPKPELKVISGKNSKKNGKKPRRKPREQKRRAGGG